MKFRDCAWNSGSIARRMKARKAIKLVINFWALLFLHQIFAPVGNPHTSLLNQPTPIKGGLEPLFTERPKKRSWILSYSIQLEQPFLISDLCNRSFPLNILPTSRKIIGMLTLKNKTKHKTKSLLANLKLNTQCDLPTERDRSLKISRENKFG